MSLVRGGGLVAVAAMLGLAVVLLLPRWGEQAPPGPADEPLAGSPGLAVVEPAARAWGGRHPRAAPPAGRPIAAPTLPGENRHTPPPARIGPGYVSALVDGAPMVLGDVALPWRYHLAVPLLDRVDEEVVHATIAEWTGHAGSRWSATFAGYTTAPGAVPDGRSVVFAEARCQGLSNANSYVHTHGGVALHRYGAQATQVLEVDIGICPRISSAGEVRRAIRHEVGHVVGLGHLCNPGDPCHREAMGAGGLGCRTMFWEARPCQAEVDVGDLEGLRTTYPTIRPLHGPSRVETAARTSFAMLDDGSADVAVVLDVDAPAVAGPPAAALAARTGGTWLLGAPDATGCLGGVVRDELARALSHRATLVLVGAWPVAPCRQLAHDWELALRHVPVEDGDTAAVALAALGPPTARVVIAGTGALPGTASGDAIPAASLAGYAGAPLLLTDPAGLPGRTLAWLAEARPSEALVVGGPAAVGTAVVSALEDHGIAVTRVHGPDRLATALQVAEAMRGDGAEAVVVAAADAAADGLAAAVVAARRGAAILLTPPTVDARVADWLAAARPQDGWAVGGPAVLPEPVLAAYGVSVG